MPSEAERIAALDRMAQRMHRNAQRSGKNSTFEQARREAITVARRHHRRSKNG